VLVVLRRISVTCFEIMDAIELGCAAASFHILSTPGTNAERDDARSNQVMSQFNSDDDVPCNFRRYKFQYTGVAETFLQVPALGLTKSGQF